MCIRDRSQAATRMTIEDMLPALETLDSIGYYSLECWGGATFDACMRFLGEDPWERLRTIRKHVKNTKLQMLFRGQNILGYKHYADDVVDAFCAKSIENGIDIIRIFDALNDVRNLEQAIKSTKKYGGQVEATLSYTCLLYTSWTSTGSTALWCAAGTARWTRCAAVRSPCGACTAMYNR